MANTGHIKQVIGPVVDVSFTGENSALPDILNALEVKKKMVRVLSLKYKDT